VSRGAESLALVRRERLLLALRRDGAIRLAEIAQELGVSGMTVRRDLLSLEREGLVERVHGGAVLPQRGTDEPGFDAKLERQSAEKRAIAQVARTMVGTGAAVGLSAGTTTWALARELAAISGITVVTNSMNAWNELQRCERDGPATILTGGESRTPSDALVGPTADLTLRSVFVDVLFLGVHGIDLRSGLTTPNTAEAETNRVFISRAKKIVVVADHTKWRIAALCTMAELTAVETLITDEGLDQEARRQLGEVVEDLRIVPLSGRNDLRQDASMS
jgi:DeoR/GlpR family transcriptional regulator of sugar metabolism